MQVYKTVRSVAVILSFLFFPIIGTADVAGGFMVFTWDSDNSSSAPPSTSATLNGTNVLHYGTNNLVTFSGYFEEGIHTVEVATETSGYTLRQSPTDPNAINDPDSDYGNPRYTSISQGETYVPVSFIYDPIISASATVRDGWTMERLEDVAIELIFEGSSNQIAITKYPETAVYASNWLTDADGNFPTNTLIYLDDYDLQLTLEGYEDLYLSNVISGASPGDHFELGTLFLYPEDLNTNAIGDAWEESYFKTDCMAQADTDADGLCNLDEYLAGTDPTNWYSCLWLFQTVETNGSILYQWETVPDRTYRLSGTTNLCANTWVQVAGAWEATNAQYAMSWSETNHQMSWCSSYRLDIMPCDWTGMNSILIRTNDWPSASSGSNTNNWGGGPPPIP